MPLQRRVTKDGILSAKSIFTKVELQALQTAFAEQVGAKYGFERGTEGSEATHLSEERFKLKMAQIDTPPAFRHGGVSNICFLVDVPS